MNRKIVSLVATAMVLPMLLVGCGKSEASNSNPEDGIKIYIGSSIFDDSLDPIKGGMSNGYPFTNDALLKVK